MAADRGFIFNYNPQDKTRFLIYQVNEILDKYSDDLPLNLRQVFYALIVDYGHEKTEQAYKRLSGHVAKARRAGMISWDAIRDDGFVSGEALTYSDANDVVEHFAEQAARVRVDRQFGQDRKISVWCEAQGMVPSIKKICNEYGVEVLSSGGFDSVTAKHDVAQRYVRSEQDILVLHIGDYDPSGETMFKVLSEDVSQFVIDISHWSKRPPTFERLALTQEQVREFNLPTAPPKKKNNTHAKNWVGGTVQLEALDPATLRRLVKAAIEAELDMEQYKKMLAVEQEIRKEVKDRLRN